MDRGNLHRGNLFRLWPERILVIFSEIQLGFYDIERLGGVRR
jgi:hypothetical protein